jgi:hypothetical protein
MIPKTFRLMGQKWTVRLVPVEDWIDDDVGGYCLNERYEILIRDMGSDAFHQQTFCHELVHAVFAGLLLQAWTTVK